MKRSATHLPALLILMIAAILGPHAQTTRLHAAPLAQSGGAPIDVTISLYSSPATATDRAPYERIIEYFADGVYEASNGVHTIGQVTIYTGGHNAGKTDIVWTDTCHPNAHISGRSVQGQRIAMCDTFATTSFLANDTGWQEGGYTIAHEWGHYYYSLYDEYRGTTRTNRSLAFPRSSDDPVPDSIMNSQWNAVGGNYQWLNFSTPLGNTKNNAQYRAYGASGWETLARPPADDPRNGERKALPQRLYYPELAGVAPAAGSAPSVQLPAAAARASLKIVWLDTALTMQLVLDTSSSMSGSRIANLRQAARLLVDLAELNRTAIGVIKFNSTVQVVQPITAIASQADKDLLKGKIDTLTASGSTAMGAAAKQGLDELLAYQAGDSTRVVFLLSDGASNTGINPISVIPDYQSAKIPLFTFGFGSSSGNTVLQRMSSETGGRYYFSPASLRDLAQVFQDARQLVAATSAVATGSLAATSAAPVEVPIVVDSSLRQLDIVTVFPGDPANATLTLVDPGGATGPAPVCSDAGQEVLCSFQVVDPAQGQWRLTATTTQAELSLSYRVNGLPRAGTFSYEASLSAVDGASLTYPAPMILVAAIERGRQIVGAVVTAQLEGPDGKVSSVAFRDDGAGPDVEAQDGLYTALVDYSRNGGYTISASFDNTGGAAQFDDSGALPSVGPGGVALEPVEAAPVGENFSRFARTQVIVSGVRSDDHGNSTGSATQVQDDNSNVAGKIETERDVDVFRIDVANPGTVIVRVAEMTFGMHPRMRILAADGRTVLADVTLNPQAYSNTGRYLFVPLTVEAANTRYYAIISDRDGQSRVGYTVSVGPAVASDQIKLHLPLTVR